MKKGKMIAGASRPVPELVINVGGVIFYAGPADGKAAEEFVKKLSPASISVGVSRIEEGVFMGDLPWELPKDGARGKVCAGDLVLCGVKRIAICTCDRGVELPILASAGASRIERLKEALNDAASVTLSLEWSE